MIDVDRIEVLRGPQNTLFGKNASAGVVNIVSRAPSEEFDASTELTATDDDEQAITGTLSVPCRKRSVTALPATTPTSGLHQEHRGR